MNNSSPNHLFLVGVDIDRGTNTEMPQPLTGAHVPVFAAAPTHERAAEMAVAVLRSQGFDVVELHSPIQQLDAAHWSSYVQENWPAFETNLLTQQQVVDTVAAGGLFFGPFAGYERH